jgi:tRNA-2-methylthio-N6-dimethylallyladenosine synthase
MGDRAPVLVTPEEIEQQNRFMSLIREHPYKPKSCHIITFGCQMNMHDSEKLAGMMQEMGIPESPTKEEAGFVLYNTCCVRDNAERRALGNVIWLKELKKRNPGLLIGVCGCMIQQQGMADKLLSQYKFIDIAFGTHNLHRFPEILYKELESRKPVVEICSQEDLIAEDIPIRRPTPYQAYITIMYGCNNFCSFCIVPYVRGRERSRSPESILAEAQKLYEGGVKEIMLLGQNVNSYGEGSMSFPKLLRELDSIGIPRIRFMTSHPKDLSDELIQVMAQGKHICPHFHLPVQSGNDEVLKAMNRRYTREQYKCRVEELRKAVPGIGITTDLIVGFPGETEAQFLDTMSLVKEVRYDAAFTFIYSPREGTRAAKMEGRIPADVAADRIKRLIAAQEDITAQIHQELIGQKEQVLVESLSKRDSRQVSGKGMRNITISFPGSEKDMGKIVPVTITSSGVSTLRGERIDEGDKP